MPSDGLTAGPSGETLGRRPTDADPAIPREIDGVPIGGAVAPSTPAEAAEILAEAAGRGLAVAPVGGGTALALGNPPERVDLALSTRRLGGIIDYEPTDLVLSVGAGARLGDVQAVLAEHGQGLPIDPPGGAEATIGGLVATALAGPDRLGRGTLRDLLIGISTAHPSGTVTKAGGMVVKNVTGFDLPRLYHGSLGTLGLIVSANFKVLPLPRAETTLLAPAASLEAALAAAGRVRASRLQPIALEAARLDGGWLTAVRLTSRQETIGSLADETRSLLAVDGERLDGAASAAWWRRYVDKQASSSTGAEAVLRCAVRPRETSRLVADVLAMLPAVDAEVRYLAVSPGLGTAVMRLGFPAEAEPHALPSIAASALAVAEQATVLAAPSGWKQGLDVWGRPPEALDVMRSLKEQFDPRRVLNPGRFAGFI